MGRDRFAEGGRLAAMGELTAGQAMAGLAAGAGRVAPALGACGPRNLATVSANRVWPRAVSGRFAQAVWSGRRQDPEETAYCRGARRPCGAGPAEPAADRVGPDVAAGVFEGSLNKAQGKAQTLLESLEKRPP